MKKPRIVFSHGQESGPWGTKIKIMNKFVKNMGFESDSVDYRGIKDPNERVEKLIDYCSSFSETTLLIGSSMGGHVATAAADKVRAIGLFVLAPAYYMLGFEELTPEPPKIPICIVHGWQDDIVPIQNSFRFASSCGATIHIIDGNHRLTENIDEICNYLKIFLDQYC